MRQHAEVSNGERSRQLDRSLSELREYEELLARPFHEIAARHGTFRERYEEQQSLLAEWIVSQNTFRSLTKEYGKRLGMSDDEMRGHFEITKKKVTDELSKTNDLIRINKEKLLGQPQRQ
ncbi:hypothetical protein [Bordetella trematum]|uniref:hypothetical protein n=1 Tax=Bordetella trematum TaxID=123899 RepID=UPI003AF3EE0C